MRSSQSLLLKRKEPWVTFIFLAGLFFLSQQDLFYSLKGRDYFLSTVSFQMNEAIEGKGERRIAFSALGLFGIVSLVRGNKNKLHVSGFLGWSFIIFLSWAFMSVLWSYDKVLTIRKLTVLAMLVLGVFGFIKKYSRADLSKLALICTGLNLLTGIVIEIVLGTFQPIDVNYRFSGALHPNSQGMNCSILFLASIISLKTTRINKKILFAISLVSLIFLILTKSRTSLACTLVCVFAYFYLTFSKTKKVKVFLLGSAVFLLLFLLFAESFPAFLGKGLLLGRTESNVSTLTNRTPIWSELFDYAIDRPFTGYGYNSFWNPDHIGNMTFIKGWGIATAHSAYLDVQLSLGIIGLAVYVLVFITGIYYGIKGFKLYGNKEYLLCSLVLLYYSAYNLMESELLAASSFMTFMFFLCTSKIGYYVNRNRRTK